MTKPATRLLSLWSLTVTLVRREIAGRYRGSVLGILWSLITPLFMLSVYTFVFGIVFKARWAGTSENASMGEFALTLFAGLTVFQLFAEVIGRAPSLVLANQSYVKKVVFPLHVLAPVALGSALFHACVSVAVLLVAILFVHGAVPWTALFVPLVLAPFCLLILGVAWFLSSLGAYIRDIDQVLGPIITALLFTSPVFFPLSAMPELLRPWAMLNPIAIPVEQARNVLIFAVRPDFVALGYYSLAALFVAMLGYLWFQKTRKGFADVL